jgi:hypothetical protein
MSVYESIDPQGKLTCMKCGVLLEKRSVRLTYLENGFPVELPVCPICNFVFIPEDLATDKILRVEKSLEDK